MISEPIQFKPNFKNFPKTCMLRKTTSFSKASSGYATQDNTHQKVAQPKVTPSKVTYSDGIPSCLLRGSLLVCLDWSFPANTRIMQVGVQNIWVSDLKLKVILCWLNLLFLKWFSQAAVLCIFCMKKTIVATTWSRVDQYPSIFESPGPRLGRHVSQNRIHSQGRPALPAFVETACIISR